MLLTRSIIITKLGGNLKIIHSFFFIIKTRTEAQRIGGTCCWSHQQVLWSKSKSEFYALGFHSLLHLRPRYYREHRILTSYLQSVSHLMETKPSPHLYWVDVWSVFFKCLIVDFFGQIIYLIIYCKIIWNKSIS